MKIEYTGRHYSVDHRIRGYTEGKVAKVAKFIDEPVEIRVTLDTEKHRNIAELHIAHRHGVLQGTEEAENMQEALSAVFEKVEKQARRARKKFMDKRRRAQRNNEEEHHWPVDVVEGTSLGAGTSHRVIRTNRFPIKPMTIDEAALQLEGSKNEFFVFLDSATERVSVLYKRKDSNYGLIAPEL